MTSAGSLILASASPRRQKLLRNAGIKFTVHPAGIFEAPNAGESPQECAQRLAAEKARAVFQQHREAFILGADTIVVVDGEMLGKPRDTNDAERMLHLLSGRKHEVITGICLIGRGKNGSEFEDIRSECTAVTMSKFSDEEIRDYIATGEPMDKAGAYAIQGMASRWISGIEGDYFNVVGLPVSLVFHMLREHNAL